MYEYIYIYKNKRVRSQGTLEQCVFLLGCHSASSWASARLQQAPQHAWGRPGPSNYWAGCLWEWQLWFSLSRSPWGSRRRSAPCRWRPSLSGRAGWSKHSGAPVIPQPEDAENKENVTGDACRRWMFALKCLSPRVFLPVVVSSRQVRVVDLLLLRCADEGARLAGLFGEAVVDVGDDGEVCALWIAKAHVDPVISGERKINQGKKKKSLTSGGVKKPDLLWQYSPLVWYICPFTIRVTQILSWHLRGLALGDNRTPAAGVVGVKYEPVLSKPFKLHGRLVCTPGMWQFDQSAVCCQPIWPLRGASGLVWRSLHAESIVMSPQLFSPTSTQWKVAVCSPCCLFDGQSSDQSKWRSLLDDITPELWESIDSS